MSASNSTPSHLYHGSAYFHRELMPGYRRSHELVKWDETESNEWLYATTDEKSAVLLGLASAVEKKFKLNRFQINEKDNRLIFTVEGDGLTYDKLKKTSVYLYTIRPTDTDVWVQNTNKHNNMKTEWKTKGTIPESALQVQRVNLDEWLTKITVEIQYVDKRGKILKPTYLNT